MCGITGNKSVKDDYKSDFKYLTISDTSGVLQHEEFSILNHKRHKEMIKINNEKEVKTVTTLMFFILIINSLIIAVLCFDIIELKNDWIILVFSALAELLFLKFIFDIKYFYFENSGEIVSIKSYPFWTINKFQWSFELPKNKIKSCHHQKKFWKDILILKFEKKEGIHQFVHYPIYFLRKKQIQDILNSF
ncbi:hypothetical protein SAMN05443633_102182 [Chryseobacterium arachidis]|uniref:Uncharacterized protein n=2 Tax=Chryseobacterium arachidis TaxID=1416778 RepID=A0A1M4WZC0_9FLAO|nr:hypothetical protein [Chryseobacterium arachidis]SHE86611.1 hypothetical protein SAMN05443633_102182 [Chryseobacterium arachidis]